MFGTRHYFYIDLGTANTLIVQRGRGLVLNEPSLIAYTEPKPRKKKLLAVGKEAAEKLKTAAGNVIFDRPLKDGVIANFESTEQMLAEFFKRPELKGRSNRSTFVISLPYGVTEVEKRAAIDVGKAVGAKKVYLIDEPMAAAIGVGIDVAAPKGAMVIDIGGGTTEVAVLALADIVYCEALRVGGHRMNQSILQYFKTQKNILISEELADEIKMKYGTALSKANIQTFDVRGRERETGREKTIQASSEDVGRAIDDDINQIILGVHHAVENTPPELVSDLMDAGIILAGGGALIRNLAERMASELRLTVSIAKDPLTAIAHGGEKLLENIDLLEKVQLKM